MNKLNLLAIVLISVFFPLNVSAQNFGTFGNIHKTFPTKIMNSQSGPISAGTYTVGASGDFPTIDSVFNRLSTEGIDGPVTFELTDNSYTAPSDAYGFYINGPIPGANQNNRIIIKPAAAVNVTIEGSGGGVLSFLNTSYLTIDGMSLTGNGSITVHSTRNAEYTHNQPISFFDNSDHNEVKNLNIMDGDNTYQAAPVGFFVNTSGSVPDSNLVENNIILGGSIGAVIVGLNSTVEPKGNNIVNNRIGSDTDSLKSYGIFVQYCNNTLIEKNIIQNLRLNYAAEQETYGIYENVSENTIIRNNVIHNLYDATGSAGAMGIVLEGGNQTSIYNNMIYDISCSSPGIYLTGILFHQETNPKIYYNSIYLFGSGALTSGSANLYVQSGTDGIDIRNNILVNTRVDSPRAATVFNDYTLSNFTSNYNDLYIIPGPDNHLVNIIGTFYNTLGEWRATGQDLNSISEMPQFINPDLHISTTDSTYIESGGTPIAGIITDIDGDLRNESTPDIGADEFAGLRLPVELISFTSVIKDHNVVLNWSTATEINNRGFEVERSAGDQDFITIGFIKGNGTSTEQHSYSYTDKNPNPGKYSYRLKQYDFDGSFEYSDIVNVNFNVPLKFSLKQNYPNPFNPATKIKYAIPKAGFITLKVYDVTGREVATLLDEYKKAGSYDIEFNAADLASGVYFYRLKAGNFSAVKKLMLLK